VAGKNVTIKDVTVEGEGITLYSNYNCSGLVVEDSTFISRSNNAVKLIADNVGGIVENVVFKNCKFIGGRMAVEIQNHGKLTPPADGVPEEWYKINGVEFEGCTFEAHRKTDGNSDKQYALSMTGYGKNVYANKCTFNGDKKGVEIAGFSGVTLQDCELTGGKESFISSNERPMNELRLRLCKLKGYAVFTNTCGGGMDWCEFDGKQVEVKHSERITLNRNKIRSTGSYGVMLNSSKDCLVLDNTIDQRGTNNSVIRCYLKGSTRNIVRGNALTMKSPKRGKWWDEYSGAKGNVFEGNTKKLV
jgi:hypothetical protein